MNYRSPQQWLASLGLSASDERLEQAFTHPSYVNEHPRSADYQRLEFLGDAVLGLCVSEMLVSRAPKAREGDLSRMRASLVNTEALSKFAREQNLGAFLRVGRGAKHDGSRTRPKVLADIVEAVVAAVYLDQGFEAARRLVGVIVKDIDEVVRRGGQPDPKSALQEFVQQRGGSLPTYELVEQSSDGRGRPVVTVRVLVEGKELAQARASSKKVAERQAAEQALAKLSAEADTLRAVLNVGSGEESSPKEKKADVSS